MFKTSPGPSKSVGRGGTVAKVDAGNPGGAGRTVGVSTSIRVKGYWPDFGADAWRIWTPVGPLEGKLAQPLSPAAANKTIDTPRNKPLRGGTQEISMN